MSWMITPAITYSPQYKLTRLEVKNTTKMEDDSTLPPVRSHKHMRQSSLRKDSNWQDKKNLPDEACLGRSPICNPEVPVKSPMVTHSFLIKVAMKVPCRWAWTQAEPGPVLALAPTSCPLPVYYICIHTHIYIYIYIYDYIPNMICALFFFLGLRRP